jgi:hypothetical protein
VNEQLKCINTELSFDDTTLVESFFCFEGGGVGWEVTSEFGETSGIDDGSLREEKA